MERIPEITALDAVLDVTMSVDDAVCGDVQRYDRLAHALELVVWRGYDEALVAALMVVPVDDSMPCGQAIAEGRRIVVRDVNGDAGYAPHRRLAKDGGWRAMQSTPLRSLAGRRIGVMSSHFATPHHPGPASLDRLDHCSRVAGLLLECGIARERLTTHGRTVRLMQRASTAVDSVPGLIERCGRRYDRDTLDSLERALGQVCRYLAAHA